MPKKKGKIKLNTKKKKTSRKWKMEGKTIANFYLRILEIKFNQ